MTIKDLQDEIDRKYEQINQLNEEIKALDEQLTEYKENYCLFSDNGNCSVQVPIVECECSGCIAFIEGKEVAK